MKYFDYAASAPLYPEVLVELTKSFAEDFANPNAIHSLGYDLFEKIESHRASFLKNLGAKASDKFYFLSSATEANNTVIKGLKINVDDIIFYSPADHPSVVVPVESLGAKHESFKILDNGLIDEEDFTERLKNHPATKLVVLTLVNNQSGMIQDVLKLAELTKKYSSAHVHIDAVQGLGKIPFKLSSHIDSVSVTSHKIGGPKGVAGLYLKSSHKVNPLIIGGGQEEGFRSSTVAYPLIAAFHLASMISLKNLEINLQKNNAIKEEVTNKLKSLHEEIIFPFQERSSGHILMFIVPGISSDILIRHLEREKIYLSSTSACSSRISGFNPTLMAMNIEEKFHKNVIRLSLGVPTTKEEGLLFVDKFSEIYHNIKKIQKKK